MIYEIWNQNDNSQTLLINMKIPGFDLYFTNNLLATNTEDLELLAIYPNPFENSLSINSKNVIDTINIYTVSGEKIATHHAKKIDTSFLASGIYFIEVQSNGQQSVQKFIKR